MAEKRKRAAVAAIALLLESSDSEDDTLFENVLNIIRIGCKRNTNTRIRSFVEGIVPCFETKEYLYTFRLDRKVVGDLISRFSASTFHKSRPEQGGGREVVSAETTVLSFLYYIGHEELGYKDITEKFSLSAASVDCVLNLVPAFLQSIAAEVIQWPTEERARLVENGFSKYGFEHAIGCIDGTHIRIDALGDQKEFYRNGKGYYSMHMQAICDHNKKFTDVYIGYPGSVHDARAYSASTINKKLPELCKDNGRYLLADRAYPLSVYCLTPYKDDLSSSCYKKFNECHSAAHRAIEDAFRLFRQRFRYMVHIKSKSAMRVASLIISCCVLHNLASDDGKLEELEEDPPRVMDPFDPNECHLIPAPILPSPAHGGDGKALRLSIAQAMMDLFDT